MKKLERGMLIEVNLDPALGSETGKNRPCIIVTNDIYNERIPVIQVVPVTSWNDKKSLVRTNVEIEPTPTNGLNKRSIADCLQTRPIDYRERLKKIRGKLSSEVMKEIDEALAVVFDLCKKE